MLRSFNVKLIVITCVFLSLLIILVVKAIIIRRERVEWLRSLNRQIVPLEIEQEETFERPAMKKPAVPTWEPAGLSEDTAEPYPGQVRLEEILHAFEDFDAGRRARAESDIYEYFNNLVAAGAREERKGVSGPALSRYEWFFDRISGLGCPYDFQETTERKRFVESTAKGIKNLPYLSRWASIRMLGIVDGKDARAALKDSIRDGIFGDQAAVSLIRAGDTDAIPHLLDYISRSRINKNQYEEAMKVIINRGDRRVIDILIEELGNQDAGMRAAALGLLKVLAESSGSYPRDSDYNDEDIRERWRRWWNASRESYAFPGNGRDRIIPLTLINGKNFLPEGCPLDEAYFKGLVADIERCCALMKRYDLESHRRGELSLFDLARRLVKDYEDSGEKERHVLKQYMNILAGEIRAICLRQSFSQYPEREEFNRWAESELTDADLQTRIFIASMLGVTGDTRTIDILSPYGKSWVEGLREAALISMGLLGSEHTVEDLCTMVMDKNVGTPEGEMMIVALERIGSPDARGCLVGILREANPLLAYEAYLALSRIEGPVGERILSLEEVEREREALAEVFKKKTYGKD